MASPEAGQEQTPHAPPAPRPRPPAPGGAVGDYVVAIHVPVHMDGPVPYLATDWLRALGLLRDSLAGQVRRIVVVAPQRPVDPGAAQQLEPAASLGEGVTVRPSMDHRCRARDYWLHQRRRWRADVRAACRGAAMAHLGLSDLFRPINWDALRVAVTAPLTMVFVRDTDELARQEGLRRAGLGGGNPLAALHWTLYDRAMRHAVGRADLSLLKGAALMARYGPQARNPRRFEDTSFLRAEILPEEARARRAASLESGRPLRLVYCGRFEARKGVEDSLRILARARALGADCRLDLIGDGTERPALEALAAGSGLLAGEAPALRFLGRLGYGPELLRRLAGYDALLFTPRAEDTPRMIFDGYAAGLPLIAFDIPYVVERQREDGATVALPFGDIEAAAQALLRLDAGRAELAALSQAARRAAFAHAAETWYARRAEWTLEAHRIRLAAAGLSGAAEPRAQERDEE